MAEDYERKSNGLMAVKLVLGLIVVFFVISFAVKNQQQVTVSYYFGHEYSAPIWFVVIFSIIAGVLISSVFWAFSLIREKGRNWSLSKKAAKMEERLKEISQRPPAPVERGAVPNLKPEKGAGSFGEID